MVDTLEIRRFKSIKHLKLDCKRIDIFIGQPNAGKSNILESLGLLSYGYYSRDGDDARRFVRFERTSHLFYDEVLDVPLEIIWDLSTFNLAFEDGRFEGKYLREGRQFRTFMVGDHDVVNVSTLSEEASAFKSYRFSPQDQSTRSGSDFLLPPYGDNLVSLMLSRKAIRELANDLFSPLGLRVGIRPQEGKLEVIKQYEDIIVSTPYSMVSETLQRVIFYMAAILSNKESVLVFEEPKSHAFPYYTKYLAECIALDENNNQFFISTHNPYFLLPIIQKSPVDEIAVFVTYFEDYETKVKPLSQDEIQRSTDMDIFSNLDMFVEGQ